MKKLRYLSLGGASMFAPMLAFAQTGDAFSILTILGALLGWIIPILITLAVIYFIWGIISYVISKDEDDQAKARSVIVKGLIGLLIISAMWGFVALLQNTIFEGEDVNNQIQGNDIPCVPAPGIVC